MSNHQSPYRHREPYIQCNMHERHARSRRKENLQLPAARHGAFAGDEPPARIRRSSQRTSRHAGPPDSAWLPWPTCQRRRHWIRIGGGHACVAWWWWWSVKGRESDMSDGGIHPAGAVVAAAGRWWGGRPSAGRGWVPARPRGRAAACMGPTNGHACMHASVRWMDPSLMHASPHGGR